MLTGDVGAILWEAELPGWSFTYVSQTAETILGYPVEQWYSEPDFWVKHLHPDDVRRCVNFCKRSTESGQDHEFEYRVIDSHQRVVWLRDTVHVVKDARGNPIQLRGVMTEITQRVEGEMHRRRLAAIVESSVDGIFSTSVDGTVASWNAGAESMFGYAATEMIGRPTNKLMAPGDTCPELEEVRRGKIVRGMETVWRRKDGSNVEVSVTAAPILDGSGQTTDISVVARDITARIDAERSLRQRERELSHLSRLATMGEMAAGIAHEVNQPLAAISNFANAAQRVLGTPGVLGSPEDPTEQLGLWMGQISEQAIRCGDIIRRLRQFTRKEGRTKSPINAAEVLRDSVELVRSITRQHGIRIEMKLADDPLMVLGSAGEIQQIYVNLIRNALDSLIAAKEAEPNVRVHAGRDGEWVRVTVEDNGPGIETCVTERIFDPFFTTRSEGMGMGLAISRSIAQRHRGRLQAVDDSSPGARFVLELPLYREPESGETPTPAE